MSGQLYALLPVYIRQRDLETDGQPLRALLEVVEEQMTIVETDIAQLYENWFIETCSDWAVPYIGDLIGYRPLRAGAAGVVPRGDVADAIRMRRRKGTLAVLEDVARNVAGWPAVAIEYERLIAVVQAIGDAEPRRGRTVDLRDAHALRAIGEPADRASHTVEIRRPGSHRAPGRYGVGSVELVVSKLHAASVSRSDAHAAGELHEGCYTFDALGFNVQLVAAGDPLVLPLRRAELAADLARLYGAERSLAIWQRPPGKRTTLELIARERIVVADLGSWRFRPKSGEVAVDPERGRLRFAPGHEPQAVVVRYHYATAADLGAGEYARDLDAIEPVFPVVHGGREEHGHLRAALRAWRAGNAARGAIEFGDSHVYDETDITIELDDDQYLEIRAADGTRPVVRFPETSAGRANLLRVTGGARSTLVLDGLLLAGGIEIAGDIGTVIVRRSTIVPRAGIIEVFSPTARLEVERSIVGTVRVVADETQQEPNQITFVSSIVDAYDHAGAAIGGIDGDAAFADGSFDRVTVLGHVKLHGLVSAQDSIFVHPVFVERRQTGCMRFSYVAPHSHAPARYACLPVAGGPAPRFLSTHYMSPGFARLSVDGPPEIATGAEDDAEMGAFHDTFEPLRAANLRQRLAEFAPLDIDVGIRYVREA
jgi:hypothetical protein